MADPADFVGHALAALAERDNAAVLTCPEWQGPVFDDDFPVRARWFVRAVEPIECSALHLPASVTVCVIAAEYAEGALMVQRALVDTPVHQCPKNAFAGLLWVSWLDESQFIRLDPHTVAALRRADTNAEACA